ncbi:MAG: hypothetical protein KatS3mg114_0001 [Planctomycetaceae bacterium]|nr:MAG: hypothetical protein KatS3mg114_0001 [Planctomycetaceae bacterium]
MIVLCWNRWLTFYAPRGTGWKQPIQALDAMQRMREYPFDVVICDVNLPDADGFHVLEWAREHVPDTQIIC